jgi:hypothetical protein
MTAATQRPPTAAQRQRDERQRAHRLEALLTNQARLLARRDDGHIDQAIEQPRQTALEAFWQWMDGCLPLEQVEAIAAPLVAEVSRPQAQRLISWLNASID